MAEFRCRTKGGADPQGKPRVYFTCHSDDFELYFDRICSDIFDVKEISCAIYYTPDMSEPLDETNLTVDLARMNLFIVPVSLRLLNEPNRAMSVDIAYAKEHRIHIIPFLMEQDISGSGIVELYSLNQNFGERQYLNPNSSDTSEIKYTDKLRKHLENVLVSDELAQRVRAAFDAYIFLSYRKKDRLYANELMRVIHGIPGCRDIAIWYDEFLTLGESWRDNIRSAMKMVKEKSNLFTLLVTPNLLEEYLDKDGKTKKNFVMETEYPEAKDMGMDILPTEAQDTDYDKLKNKYEDIPKPLRLDDEHFSEAFLLAVEKIAKTENDDDPEHNFLIGLAYLEGIDVEVDVERGVSLITSAAEAGLPEAMRKLYNLYKEGDGVALNYPEALKWVERLFDFCSKNLPPEHPERLDAMSELAFMYNQVEDYQKAYDIQFSLYEILMELYGLSHPDTLEAYSGIAFSSGKLGDYRGALEANAIIYALQCKILGENHDSTLISLNNLATNYADIGDLDKALELHDKGYLVRREKYGKDHPETLISVSNIAYTLNEMGDRERAIRYYEKLCDLLIKIYGEKHPDVISTLNMMANVYYNLENYKKACELMERVCELSFDNKNLSLETRKNYFSTLTGLYILRLKVFKAFTTFIKSRKIK